MSGSEKSLRDRLVKEGSLLAVMTFVGLILLPIAIYVVGRSVFGDFGNRGFAGFYGYLQGEFRAGEPIVWFLLFSPYILWQLLRLTLHAFRRLRTPPSD